MTKFPDIYPWVHKLVSPTALSLGPLTPLGVCIHYLADRNVDRSIMGMKEAGLGYHLIIDRDGKIYQTTYFNLRVNHAGIAEWNGLSPNRHFIAIALASWGYLNSKNQAWNGTTINVNETALRTGNVDKKLLRWDAATQIQETALVNCLSWLISKGISIKNICGHDECAKPPGRKQDPGGILSRTMSDMRQLLETMQSKKPIS
jgi:N-acetyl-anhydromuramyl-L-alanine amidase AmpD